MAKRELKIKDFTKIPYEYIKGDNIMKKEKLMLLTYILMTNNNKNTCIFNIKWLCEVSNTKLTNFKRIKFIRDTLKEFQKENILYFSGDIMGYHELDFGVDKVNSLDLIFARINNLTDQFTIIYDEDIIALADYCDNDNRIDRSRLIYLYTYISSFINEDPQNENYKLGYPSIELLESQTGLSNKTILKYRRILKDLNIINYDYLGCNISTDEFKLTNTYYCRMEDTNKLKQRMEALNCIANTRKFSEDDKKKINSKRSIKQRINYLSKKQILNSKEIQILNGLKLEYADLCI